MKNSLKSELRKLYTIRSSYIVPLICLIFALLFAFYGTGFKSTSGELNDSHLIINQAKDGIAFLGFIGSLVAVLLVSHEYRYNLVTYTITITKRRTQVLVGKSLAITIYALVFSAFFIAIVPLLAYFGLQLSGHSYVSQSLDFATLWHCLLAGWAYFIFAYVISILVRNQVGAIVTALVMPTVAVQLLSLVFRGEDKYLPYHALNNVIYNDTMSSGKAAIVVLAYVAAGWLISWFFFLRRDAL